MKRCYLCLSLLPAIVAIGCVKSGNPADDPGAHSRKGVLAGTIIGGTDLPIAGATITTEPATRSVTTDSAGRYFIPDIAEGTYRVIASKSSSSSAGNYLVNAGDTTTANIRLAIWELAWSDEFDGTEIDRDRWNIFEGGTGVPDQLHWASPDEVLVGDGILRLRSRKRELNGFHYTSGDVNSRYFQQYGRFEVRARLPRGQGIWPAHWLWPVDAGTPEIDIMEMLGNVPNIIHMTYHFQDQKGDRLQSGMIFNGPDFSQDFHTFCVEWYPDEIRWLIDGVERFRTANIDPPKPLHIILDTYIGGNWPGDPDSTTIFPQYHDIDYVRVYRSAE